AAVLMPVQPSRQHARVVEDEQVVGTEQRRQLGESPIYDPPGIAVAMQQPTVAAALAGVAGDQIVGQVIRELAAQHGPRMLAERDPGARLRSRPVASDRTV